MLTNIKQKNCSCSEDKYSTNGIKCTHLGSVLPNNLERRSGIERCQYSYNNHIPERRSARIEEVDLTEG